VRGSEQVAIASSDADGTFEASFPGGERVDVLFDGAVQDLAWDGPRLQRLTIRSGGAFGAARDVLPGAEDVVLVAGPVPHDGSLVVRVLDPDGRPLSGATLSASVGDIPVYSAQARTDGAGWARLEPLPVWPCRVDVGADGFASTQVTDVVADGREVVVTLRRAGGSLRGRVVGPDGAPLAGAWIGAYDEDGIAAAFGTDAEGRFDSPANRAEGASLQLTARHPHDEPTLRGHATVRVGADEPTIALRPVPPGGSRPRVRLSGGTRIRFSGGEPFGVRLWEPAPR
jgi:hypothetical protein